MTEDIKKQLCELAGVDEIYYTNSDNLTEVNKLINYGILNKAKDAINREGKWRITIAHNSITIWYTIGLCVYNYHDHNNSEQQALEAALTYILEQGVK